MVACLRHADLQPALDPVTGAVRPHAQAATAAPAEWAALEIALRVAQAWGGRVLAVTATGRDLPPEFKGNGNSDDLVLAFFFSYTAAKAWERFRNQLLANSYGNCTLPIEAGRDEPQLDDLYNMRFFV